MKSILIFIVVAFSVMLGGPDPSPTNTYVASLFDHNEQGGLKWEIKGDAASNTFVGATTTLDSKFAMACDLDATYTVSFVVLYQSKLIDALPLPGYPNAYLGGVTIHPDASTSINMPTVPIYQTAANQWIATAPIVAPGTFSGSTLNSPDFGLAFHAFQSNDAAVYVNVRILVTVTEQ